MRGGPVRVLAFAPGVTRTEFFDRFDAGNAASEARSEDPTDVAVRLLSVVSGDNPPPSVVSGRRNHWLTVLPRLFTRRRAVIMTADRTMSSEAADPPLTRH